MTATNPAVFEYKPKIQGVIQILYMSIVFLCSSGNMEPAGSYLTLTVQAISLQVPFSAEDQYYMSTRCY